MKWYYWTGIVIVVGLVGYLTYHHFANPNVGIKADKKDGVQYLGVPSDAFRTDIKQQAKLKIVK